MPKYKTRETTFVAYVCKRCGRRTIGAVQVRQHTFEQDTRCGHGDCNAVLTERVSLAGGNRGALTLRQRYKKGHAS